MRAYIYILLFFPLLLNAQEFHLKSSTMKKDTINSIEFTIKKLNGIPNHHIPETIVEFYRGKKMILSHTLSHASGDGTSMTIELGKYEIKKDSIIFYSYWAWEGDAPADPYGVRKQIYTVQDNGHIKPAKGSIYLEACREGWGSIEYEGVDYIYNPPKNKEERRLLSHYKKTIEKEYHASFVTGTDKDKLFREIRKALEKEITIATKGWGEKDSVFGYKK